MIPLVLASGSPRRRELLALLGLTPEIAPPNVDETMRPGEDPAAYVERIARAKAAAVHRPQAVVVAADTTVVVGREVLAKPESPQDAARMLRLLSGRDHLVHTAIAATYRNDTASGVETTRVFVRELGDDLIEEYVATGEPLDKAGAYGIQGLGAVLVERIEGDYFTVMGLGLVLLMRLLRDVGLGYHFGVLAPLSPQPSRR